MLEFKDKQTKYHILTGAYPGGGGGTQVNHVVIREQNNAGKGSFLSIVAVQADRV